MPRFFPFHLVAVVCLVLIGGGIESVTAEEPTAAATAEQIEFFEDRIRPVLVKHCYECHSNEADDGIQAGLSVENRASLRKGGDTGAAIVPGKPDESLLYTVLLHQEDNYQMPPEGKLPDAVIADVRRWITDGAADPRTGSAIARGKIDLEQGRQFWSFQPITEPHPPLIAPGDENNLNHWIGSPIDRFLAAHWIREGIEPAPLADREMLIRRLSFDLTGLPPTPETVAAFVADPAPDAYERLVDRLLTSPRFGERWGRHWLDVTRFAESSGGGRTLLFREAWQFRDYAIRSFNADKPYDVMIREHLAGDLMTSESIDERADQLAASGFLTLGPTNFENQDKEALRMEVIDEQIDTTGKVFLGMTVGCARCHDHKFDPIPTTDYYALAGIFQSTGTMTPGNVNGYVTRELPQPEPEATAWKQHLAARQQLDGQISKARAEQKRLDTLIAGKPGTRSDGPLPGIVLDETQAELKGDWPVGRLQASVGDNYRYAQPGGSHAVFRTSLPRTGLYDVRIGYSPGNNRTTAAPVTITHADGAAEVTVNQRKTPELGRRLHHLGRFRFEAGQVATLTLRAGPGGVTIADGVQWLPVEAPKKSSATPEQIRAERERAERIAKLTAEREAIGQTIKRFETERKDLDRNAPAAPRRVMSAVEAKTQDCEVRIRGDVHTLGPVVPRGFLRVIDGPEIPIPADQSGRLELAEWIAAPENPLTARVMANRVWLHLFGRGLVRTPDNFGSTGQPPTHPQLLDYLAQRLRSNGWRIKPLVREIVLSRSYRLSDAATESAMSRDEMNDWFSWRPRRRLDAEGIRDAILSASGSLDSRMYGPGIPSKTRSGREHRFESVRRSVYVPVFRNRLLDILEVFDFADPNIVRGQRNVSTLPTQALFLMNSEFVREQAEATADRLLIEAGTLTPQRIDWAWRTILGRRPTADEERLASRFLDQFAITDGDDVGTGREGYTRLVHSLFACLDFRYIR